LRRNHESKNKCLALSPDQTKIAYLTDDHTLKIRNIETREEHETTIDERLKYPQSTLTFPSHLVWSPDGKEILLTLEVNVCGMEDDARHSIIKIDAGNMSQKTVVLEDPNRPLTLEWADNGMVLVEDENMKDWWLNPRNGQMTERK
jgi:WD40 repeat protein